MEMLEISRHTIPSTALRAGEVLFLFLPPFEKEDRGGFSYLRS